MYNKQKAIDSGVLCARTESAAILLRKTALVMDKKVWETIQRQATVKLTTEKASGKAAGADVIRAARHLSTNNEEELS